MDAIAGRFLSLGEASMARSALEAAGIECWLADDAIVGLDWQMSQAVGLIKVKVREEDLEAARAILHVIPTPSDSEGEESGGRDAPNAPITCPECASPNFEPTRRLRLFLFAAIVLIGIGAAVGQTVLAFTAIAGVAIAILTMPSHRCTSCDHRWSPEFDQQDAPPPDPRDTVETICPRCGSADVFDIDYRRLKAVPLLFTPAVYFVGPLWLTLPKKYCSACSLRM